MSDLSEIYNFLPLSDRVATAGQPTEAQFAEVARQGYEVVVNLALPTSDHALPDEKSIVEGLGMAYIAIPVLWENPTQEDLDQFFQVMEAHQGRKVLVHCAANMRVSAFMYLYQRLQAGMDEATAQRNLHKIWQPNELWQAFMARSLTHYGL
ncbi:MAG: phosphatase [Leptolyngbyaceae cyanobacterium SM2_5_2]|nr:phosphatase [Leptolyngbyaceae cyanobacterium SM2_5_2]